MGPSWRTDGNYLHRRRSLRCVVFVVGERNGMRISLFAKSARIQKADRMFDGVVVRHQE